MMTDSFTQTQDIDIYTIVVLPNSIGMSKSILQNTDFLATFGPESPPKCFKCLVEFISIIKRDCIIYLSKYI